MFRFSFFLFFSVLVGVSCKKQKESVDTQGKTDSTGTPGTGLPGPGVPGDPSGLGGYFLYGSNMGYYPGWSDEQLAEVLIGNPAKKMEGVGVNSLRPALYDHFVQEWGYNIRVDVFKAYQQLGGKDHTVFLNGPSDAHKDKTRYCNGTPSQTFANLYEPIWTAAGKVNENNYYANYVYNVVKHYGPYVKYWEVWNEPDYTTNWQATQTWATSDPDPCDLTNFSAPVQAYVRMLRITWEIVKQLDKNDLVCVGGLGYPGFLDALLRNTDNPDGGAVTSDYPKKGGEWFDCLSYHVYPMFDVGNSKNSDMAAAAIVNHKNDFQAVLNKYAYNGTTHPAKAFLVTETNIPRKAIGGYIGGDEVQRNFLIKAAVSAQKAGINGLYIYGPAESRSLAQATDPYQAMGFYQQLTSGPYNATATPGGIAWRTTSNLLKNRRYDPQATANLKFPSGVSGGAFYSTEEKNYIYVLWAKASGATEAATAQYRFPEGSGIQSGTLYLWDNSSSAASGTLNLTAAPVFFKP